MDWSTVLTELPKAVPVTIGALVGGLVGGAMTQYVTHHFTRKREHEKLLREKAEELVKTLCQIRHTLFVWHEEMMRQAKASEPRGEETQAEFVARRRSASREYQDVVPSLLSDLTRAKTLQLLYFPSLKRYLERIGNFIFQIPGSPRRVRLKEVVEGAPVKADEGWTERVKRGKTAALQTCQYPNSVRPDDGRTLWGLARLQADLCRALGGVPTGPSALPDFLL